MAEVAGLVLGSVALTSLVGQCLTTIRAIDAAANCSTDYQDSALALTMLGRRLDRWAITSKTAKFDDEGDETLVKIWLEQIQRSLDSIKQKADRYETSQMQPTRRSKAVGPIVERLHDRFSNLALRDRTRWALWDQDRINNALLKLNSLVDNLDNLFGSLRENRVMIAADDAMVIVHPSSIEELSKEALQAVGTAAARVDPDFDIAAAKSSNTYRNINAYDKAKVSNGNYHSEGWARTGGAIGKGGGHSYDGIKALGEARVQNGDIFGGKSPLDDF